MALCKCDCYY